MGPVRRHPRRQRSRGVPDRQGAPGALPLIRSDLSASLVELAWIFSLAAVVAATTAFVAPTAGLWVGPRQLVLLGLVCLAVGSPAGSLAGTLPLLTLTWLSQSAGLLLMSVGGHSLLVNTAPPGAAASAMGFWPAATPSGTAIAMFTTPTLGQAAGWRTAWIVGAVIAVVSLFLVLLVVSAHPQALLMLERLISYWKSHSSVTFTTFDDVDDDFRARFPFNGDARPDFAGRV